MDEYVHQCMITYIGNKRKLVSTIGKIVESVMIETNKQKLNMVDGFCGSTVVARSFMKYSNDLYTNDMEQYSYLMSNCFLKTPSKKDKILIENHISNMNNLKGIDGIISKDYSPNNTNDIKEDERCFYTRENAQRIDAMRKYIDDKCEDHLKDYCLVPLLVKSSIHTNTSGVFKGFYKNKEGLGCFGGSGKNALSRILKRITLEVPIWYNTKVNVKCYNDEIQTFVEKLPNNIDLVYLDPPYNQHPYGSNYFMLNVIANNKVGDSVSKVSGIPKNWNKSDYNYKQKATDSMATLLKTLSKKTKYILLSYNNEGIITDWDNILSDFNIKKYEIDYNTFKGSRNLMNRSKDVVEIMYLLSSK